MGVGCCMKLDTENRQVVLQKTKEDREKAFTELKIYYKVNKGFMQQKIRAIYKQVAKTGKYETDTVNLNFVSFQKTKAEYLFRVLPYFVNLHILKLWKSGLGADGMKLITHELGNLESLEVLSLEANSLGPDGCMYLCASLKKLIKLKELWLHINDIGVMGATCLAEVLGHLKRLEKIGLDENSMENQGTLKLVTVLKNLTHIKLLGLGYNMLTEDACLNIAVLLSQLPLDKLTLSGNTISEAAHTRIITLLPRTLIIF